MLQDCHNATKPSTRIQSTTHPSIHSTTLPVSHTEPGIFVESFYDPLTKSNNVNKEISNNEEQICP
jgi:hypothetical protein